MAFHVFRPTSRGKKSRFYSAKFTLPDWPRPRVLALRMTQKDIAEEKARAMHQDFERESVGLQPLHAARKAARTPLAPHLAAFLDDVKARGRAPATVRVYRVVLGALCKHCKWDTASDATASSFEAWRNSDDVSPKYANNALGYARTFFAWLIKRRLLSVDPLANVEKIKIREDRGKRYAPTLEQLRKLLETAPTHRATVYLVAIYTGLRRFELNGLTWGDLELDGASPSYRVAGSISKNARTTRLPLRVEAAEALRAYRPDHVQPFEWVFRNRVPNMRTFRRDLKAAGIAQADQYGRKFDFHALRTTLGTLLSASGAKPRDAMELMRHSEMKLTMKTYMDTSHLPLAATVAALPSLSLPEKHTQKLDQKTVISGQIEASAVPPSPGLVSGIVSVSVSSCRGLAISDSPGGEGEMVGLVRFEATEPPKQIAERQLHKESNTMPHTQKLDSVTSLRQQLTEADSKRRELLVALFLSYAGDTGPIIRTLFAEAGRRTLEKVEVLLSVDLPHDDAQP